MGLPSPLRDLALLGSPIVRRDSPIVRAASREVNRRVRQALDPVAWSVLTWVAASLVVVGLVLVVFRRRQSP